MMHKFKFEETETGAGSNKKIAEDSLRQFFNDHYVLEEHDSHDSRKRFELIDGDYI